MMVLSKSSEKKDDILREVVGDDANDEKRKQNLSE